MAKRNYRKLHPDGPRWHEMRAWADIGEHWVRWRYSDGSWEAFINDKQDDEWLWSIYKDDTVIATGSEDLLYRAKYEAVRVLKKFRGDKT